ncbi:MAG: bifunctional UDP-N-acetylmuramoyl-tripeptide:D-alanyl-D-alanine ligase/alanine racemase [Opitutaceae bacterium]|nr:bifunctional UDP-N-acetylmuramoyl-tripeptide:D-alanyl-D-alanine ligase/alanine racemase [Cytophagales bacterium]
MSLLFSQLPNISIGKIISFSFQQEIGSLTTDSRNFTSSKGALFFAVKGKNHDGHLFLKDLYEKGIRQFVVEDESRISDIPLPECNVFLAKKSLDTLQDIVICHRNKFDLEVIGITGSNGKTIVKEWLYQLLSPDYHIVKSPKSYNSQIGVPLSVWQLNSLHNLAIFEAGISKTGEMEKLERIIKPTVGIFTNIGPAHSEGFKSNTEKIEEKARLFNNCQTIIYRKDQVELKNCLENIFNPKVLVSWSIGNEATYNVSINNKELKSTTVKIKYGSNEAKFLLPFKDDASIENVLHCIITMLHFKISDEVIQTRIASLNNIPMRLELKEGRNNSYIIDDTYNNDLEGLKIALQFMQQQNLKKKRIVILSDMLETGKPDQLVFKEISEVLLNNGISWFIGIGIGMMKNSASFPEGSLFFPNTNAFIDVSNTLEFSNSLILIKGARIFKFENIVQSLAQKIHRTVLEINLNALTHNLNVYRQMLEPTTKMMVMVKAFAYGSGSHEVAHLLQYQKVDYLAVAYTDEGIALRENNITIPIMVMNPAPEEFSKMVQYNLEPEIYNFRLLNEYNLFIKRSDYTMSASFPPVHLAIDTGMHRLGFEEPLIDELCKVLKQSHFKVASIFSHLAGSGETEHDEFSYHQAYSFKAIADKIEGELKYGVIKHILNSAGITRLPQFQFGMVRLGIGMYGVESDGHPQNNKLENVSTLKTVVSQIRTVKKGESIGYSRKGIAIEDIQVATVAIGYGDGYSRKFSGGFGQMYIKGQLAPVIGSVCMDLCMLNVTGIEVQEGDEVIIFGKEIPVSKIASEIGTISYEILTNVSERVKRIFYVD